MFLPHEAIPLMRTRRFSNEISLIAVFGICVGGCTIKANSSGSGGASRSGGSSGSGGSPVPGPVGFWRQLRVRGTQGSGTGGTQGSALKCRHRALRTSRRAAAPRVLATSTRMTAGRAWRPTAPFELCTPRTTGRSIRSGRRTARPRTSAPSLPGDFANSADQDTFCGVDACTISIIYDQSGQGNHLTKAPAGMAKTTPGNEANAKSAPPPSAATRFTASTSCNGVGYRNNTPCGTATGDNAETEYMVVAGDAYNGGCCFDYGNMETSSRDDGEGTMEAVYFGNCTIWSKGGRQRSLGHGGPREWSLGRQHHPLRRQQAA